MKWRTLCTVALLSSMAGVPYVNADVKQRPVSPLAGPTKQLADAQANLIKARSALLVIRKRVEATFESKPDWKAAKEAVDKAKATFDAVDHKLSSKLEASAAYKAEIARRDKAQAILDSAPQRDVPTSDDTVKLTDADLAAAGKQRTDSALAIKAMQKQSQENDPEYIDAHQKYVDARQAWDALQTQVDEAMKADPDYAPAQKAVDDAEAQVKQARDSLNQAQKALHPAVRH